MTGFEIRRLAGGAVLVVLDQRVRVLSVGDTVRASDALVHERVWSKYGVTIAPCDSADGGILIDIDDAPAMYLDSAIAAAIARELRNAPLQGRRVA